MPRAYGRAIWRLCCFAGITLLFIPFHWLLAKMKSPLCYPYGRFILSAWCRAVGYQITIRGKMTTKRPTLFVANHSSYIDILVLGGIIPARFVAKQEVAKWPFMGLCATNQGTIYIERNRTAIADGMEKLLACVEEGDSLILFPEGTTTDGCRVLPFGSSFFDVAIIKNMTVQPITITYAGWDGLPMPRFMRKRCGWFSLDMDLGPHLWDLSQWGTIQVIVEFHPSLAPQNYNSRKELAHAAFQVVQEGLVNAFKHPKEAAA